MQLITLEFNIMNNEVISEAMTISLAVLFKDLPEEPEFVAGIRRAPRRKLSLTNAEIELALKNALRYIPEQWQETLAPEFLD